MQGTRVWSLIWRRFPGEGNGNWLQYSCLENPIEPGWLHLWGCKELNTIYGLNDNNWPLLAANIFHCCSFFLSYINTCTSHIKGRNTQHAWPLWSQPEPHIGGDTWFCMFKCESMKRSAQNAGETAISIDRVAEAGQCPSGLNCILENPLRSWKIWCDLCHIHHTPSS